MAALPVDSVLDFLGNGYLLLAPCCLFGGGQAWGGGCVGFVSLETSIVWEILASLMSQETAPKFKIYMTNGLRRAMKYTIGRAVKHIIVKYMPETVELSVIQLQ